MSFKDKPFDTNRDAFRHKPSMHIHNALCLELAYAAIEPLCNNALIALLIAELAH